MASLFPNKSATAAGRTNPDNDHIASEILAPPSKSSRLTTGRSFHSRISDGDGISDSYRNNNSNGRNHDMTLEASYFRSSRRRLSATTMDATSVMHRLRISMVGTTGTSIMDDDEDDKVKHEGYYDQSTPSQALNVPWDTLEQCDTPANRSPNENQPIQSSDSPKHTAIPKSFSNGWLTRALGQLPAIVLIGIFHLMIGIPFGVSYFPMQWTSSSDETGSSSSRSMVDNIDELPEGVFPIPGKEAFGIRLFLFSTMVGQIIFTFYSGFPNPIGLQMVENIGFTKELAAVAISHQGYGLEALSTLMVMFGIASVLVGVVFYLLGRFHLGNIVYFFPTHVLIGLIGGIGILLCKTGLEVTIADTLSIPNIVQSWELWIVIVGLEGVLRFLEWLTSDSKRKPRFALLSPVFFCLITPCFYLALWSLRIPVSAADDAGYFFPPMVHESESATGGDFGTPRDVWKVIDFSKVSWAAIAGSLPTMFALVLFSLIHVPINIPAFALSTKVDVDMNQELIAHGFSNMIAGLCGGLQNYMAYTQSVLYDKSGGTGRVSGSAVAIVTGTLFFVGPTLAAYVPRCMAGTLLLHVGIDLFLEGVYDSIEKFDRLEYCGIWLIVFVMSFYGMEAAMVAGGIAAVSTYAVQSVTYLNPIRGFMPATTLRSSHWNRSRSSEAILESPEEGRGRILVIQLQGHLFFGNMAFFTEQIHSMLKSAVQRGGNETSMASSAEDGKTKPLVLIMDCSLVLGIDSSAAHAIVKLKDMILKQYTIQFIVFVTGSEEGFPTEYNLRGHLSRPPRSQIIQSVHAPHEATSLLEDGESVHTGSLVCDSLDLALMEAEDALIARVNPALVHEDKLVFGAPSVEEDLTLEDEERECLSCLKDLSPQGMSDKDAALLFSCFQREVYQRNDRVWVQGENSDSVKLVVSGQLIAELENEAGTTEKVTRNNIVGELGLVNGDPRMSTLRVTSQQAVLYSMSKESFQGLIESHPRVARYIDLICVKFLALRVQHVSNRIFETRCLPI